MVTMNIGLIRISTPAELMGEGFREKFSDKY